MTADKPICSLSLDLDNQWSYLKSQDDPGWEEFPSHFDLVVPRFLKILDDFGWKITVFVVGQDAALEKNRETLQMIADAGHEIGNHSFNHDTWLHLYSRQQIEDDICRAEETIERATGQRPRGFRGPGYSLSGTTLEVLAERDYLYDASTLPTFLGPLARAYLFFKSGLRDTEKDKRKKLFGGIRDGFRPVKPYLWELGDNRLLEIPVTTMPVFKLPIHFSYILFLATFSARLSSLYFRNALSLCRITGTQPSLLLHPLDFTSSDEIPELAFFPAMNLSLPRKLDLLRRSLSILASRFLVVGMSDHANHVEANKGVAEYTPERMSLGV